MKILAYTFICLLYFSCSDTDTDYCFSFDERQCNTDVWKDLVNVSLTDQEKLEAFTNYLNRLDLNVLQAELDPAFHDAVCEACDVCPTGTRFFIKIDSDPGTKLDDINLLNFEEVSCGSIF